jgi:hypothetical protein
MSPSIIRCGCDCLRLLAMRIANFAHPLNLHDTAPLAASSSLTALLFALHLMQSCFVSNRSQVLKCCTLAQYSTLCSPNDDTPIKAVQKMLLAKYIDRHEWSMLPRSGIRLFCLGYPEVRDGYHVPDMGRAGQGRAPRGKVSHGEE